MYYFSLEGIIPPTGDSVGLDTATFVSLLTGESFVTSGTSTSFRLCCIFNFLAAVVYLIFQRKPYVSSPFNIIVNGNTPGNATHDKTEKDTPTCR